MTWQSEPPGWARDTPEAEAVFNLLAQYLNQSSSSQASLPTASSTSSQSSQHAATTAQKLNDLFTTAATSSAASPPSTDPSNRFLIWRSLLRYFFATVFHILAQSPPPSNAHQDLVILLLVIRSTPSPDDPPPEFYDTGGTANFWEDLPTWRSVWTDFERRAPLPSRPDTFRSTRSPPPWPGRDLSGVEWGNLNAFLAYLHVKETRLGFVDVRGLFAMIDALEDNHPAQTLDNLVPAAAWWILEAGRALKNNDTGYPTQGHEDGSRRLPWSRGDLWDGLSGFNEARWHFWRGRFAAITGRQDVLADTREIASQAAERMRSLEEET